MASYKAGFDPPIRPGDASRTAWQVAYIQAGPSRSDRREADIAHISGEMEPRRGHTFASRQQTGIPRPNTQDPSPSRRLVQEYSTREGPISPHGYGRQLGRTSPAVAAPEMKAKSSRNVLRRKPSSIAQHAGSARSGPERAASASPTKWSQTSAESRPSIEASLKSIDAYNEIFTRAPRTQVSTVDESPAIIPELDRYRARPEHNVSSHSKPMSELPFRLATQDLPPPTPLLSGTPAYSGTSSSYHRYSGYSGSGYSASPSTRFSESPGPGAYSRDTTPTSMSSQSPGIIAPLKISTPRLRQGSPALNRPPVTRRRAGSAVNDDERPSVDPQGLPALRESITSSSSNSTVKGGDKANKKAKEKEKIKKKRLSPLPPSPPPRKSSQKFQKSPPEQQDSPSKSSRAPSNPVMPLSSESSPARSVSRPPPQKKTNPPTRPSREGAPDLKEQLGESLAIIQSNLSGLNFPQDRRRSAIPHGTNSPSPVPPTRPLQNSRAPTRNASPRPVQPSPREATPTPAELDIVPGMRPHLPSSTASSPALRAPSPSVTTKPRFGLFSRRNKTTFDMQTADPKEKPARKGPAAGTGHEGYGRIGLRGRSTSAGTTARTRDRSMSRGSSSQESPKAHDPFLLERMSPVVIAGGGGIIENRNTSSELSRTDSNQSLPITRPSLESKGSSTSGLSQEASRTTLWPSALPREPLKRASVLASKGRRPSDSSDDAIAKPSALAFRRSIQRLNSSTGALHLPRPLKLSGVISPSMSSLDASIMSDESQLEAKVDRGRGRGVKLTKPKKLEKRAKSPEKRKWNIFGRSQPSKKSIMPVAVGKPASKAVPHYAMMDSSDEQQDLEGMDLEDILRNAERDADVISLTNEELDLLQYGDYKENLPQKGNFKQVKAPLHSDPPTEILFSSPEPLDSTPELPQTELHLNQETTPIRPSRLPQVGRIPKVVSARPVATSPKSFSRPFARLSTAQPLLDPLVVDNQSVALGPSPPRPSTPEIQLREFESDASNGGPRERKASADSRSESTAASHREFLAFSQRKDSATTTSSSGGMSFAGTTAVIPEADAAMEEDEVWDEYDDLIENDDTVRAPVSATSSHGVPFQYESYESRRIRKSKMQPNESPTLTPAPLSLDKGPSSDESTPRKSVLTASSVYSADMTSRLREALTTLPSPTTPMSFTDFFSGYGDRNNSVIHDSGGHRKESSTSSQKSNSSNGQSRKSGSGLMTIAEQDSTSPISQVNLRVGSMTVSKWLTFGHVLFSPAREEMVQPEEKAKRHSILIIDGLGNDDWSFYAAETYPSSTFYNLSPTRPISASQRASSVEAFPLTPPNHRQVQYLSTLHKFPFPSSTFQVVVFRFPTAMSESSYRNVVAEAKRVLKPSGYLEMAILDLDMMNMGNRARRAVRSLKVQIQVADPTISLASASDTILGIVGRRGFTDVKSCKVGVPVASAIPSSPTQNTANVNAEEISLVDMMKDASRAGDEGITKMVAKVGRWWYTRCYEMAVLPDGDTARSIFNDQELLSECEKWSASFQLVVAYAQKPVVGRRRTASM